MNLLQMHRRNNHFAATAFDTDGTVVARRWFPREADAQKWTRSNAAFYASVAVIPAANVR